LPGPPGVPEPRPTLDWALLRRQALDATAEAYENGDPALILETKNRFYDGLFEGAGSETLSSMIGTLHVRIWRWRALGLSHPQRSPERSKESVAGLRAVLAAIRERDADLAERRMRDEVTRAASEVMHLLPGTSFRNS